MSRHLHRHELGVRSGHEVGDSADLALGAPVEPLAEAAVRNAVRSDGVHHLHTADTGTRGTTHSRVRIIRSMFFNVRTGAYHVS